LFWGYSNRMVDSAPRILQKVRGALLFMLVAACLLNACLPLPEIQAEVTPTPSETPSPSPTATETIVWFPPTATFTPLAVREVQPTQDLHPALGEVLLMDDFGVVGLWPETRSAAGRAAYGTNEFTLAVSASRGMTLSLLPEPEFGDFFLEIDVFPSLCREKDVYGLMVRAQSMENYYRVLVNCGGEARVERVKDSKTTPLQDWTYSGQMATGALVKTRLSIWALRDEMRIFVNDLHQFTVRDPLWRSGKIGLLARAAGDSPVTMNFSNLKVRAIDPEKLPTQTPVPSLTVSPTATRRP
jgi:hypothetical protein